MRRPVRRGVTDKKTSMPDVASHRPSRWVVARVAGAALAGATSAVVAFIALPAALFVLIVGISLPPLDRKQKWWMWVAVAVGAIGASIGSVRFVVGIAAHGIVSAGQGKTSRYAVSHLREVLFAEDGMRKTARLDHDGDGIGSAALLGELTGQSPLRGRDLLDPAVLSPRWRPVIDTPIGPAARVGGYLFIVCLPTTDGGWTAKPDTAIDEERAERRFVAYAWPDRDTRGVHDAFFIDQHERILTSTNHDGKEPKYASANFPPPCAAAVAESETASEWSVWREKKPRTTLPGAE